MTEIVKLGKSMKIHIEGILEVIQLGINSAVVEGLNNKFQIAFKRSYRFKTQTYRYTIIYQVAGGLELPLTMLKRSRNELWYHITSGTVPCTLLSSPG